MIDTIFKPGEYVTRDGRKARVYATNGAGIYPIHGATENRNELWTVQKWREDGGFLDEGIHSLDLMPPKQVRYVNVYKDEVEGAWSCRNDADRSAARSRLACIRIEFTEGQYDD